MKHSWLVAWHFHDGAPFGSCDLDIDLFLAPHQHILISFHCPYNWVPREMPNQVLLCWNTSGTVVHIYLKTDKIHERMKISHLIWFQSRNTHSKSTQTNFKVQGPVTPWRFSQRMPDIWKIWLKRWHTSNTLWVSLYTLRARWHTS